MEALSIVPIILCRAQIRWCLDYPADHGLMDRAVVSVEPQLVAARQRGRLGTAPPITNSRQHRLLGCRPAEPGDDQGVDVRTGRCCSEPTTKRLELQSATDELLQRER